MSGPELSVVQTLLDTGGLINSQSGALTFSAGSCIFREGDVADCAYMVDSGYVEVSRKGQGEKKVLAVLGAGEIFGEISLIDGLDRSATATALHETKVVLIDRKQLLEAVNTSSPLAKLVLVAAIKRLRGTHSVIDGTADEPDWSEVSKARSDPFYDETRIDAANQMRLRLQLELAIRKKQFDLAYQPIVTLADGRTSGFEALIRWPQPGQRPISPVDFIPLAEKTGLIIPMGIWILETALQALRNIDRKLGPRQSSEHKIFMSVNVSPRQLDSDANVENLARVIEQSDLDPSRIKLEITEEALLVDPTMATLRLARLKATGVSLAIDDFGTGYSSLSYLSRFPLDTLKVDRSFVTGVADDSSGQRIVAAIIGLAHQLGMDVVAEGIEELKELQWLNSQSCRYGQGYFLAKPSPLTSALSCLDRHFEW